MRARAEIERDTRPVAALMLEVLLDIRDQNAAAPSARGAAVGGPVFPPYGKSKSAPVAGASMGDLKFYEGGCLRTLTDPSKAKWHDRERALLTAIHAEIVKQGGKPDLGDARPPEDDRQPQPEDEAPAY